jgi:hypothetical protein
VEQGVAEDLVTAYDQFLSLLDDSEKRERLEKLPQGEAEGDEVFRDGKDIARRFDRALQAMFFDAPQELSEPTRHYGVF